MRGEELTAAIRSRYNSYFLPLTPYPALLTILLFASACSTPPPQSLQFTGPTMGSTWSVQVPFTPAELPAGEIEQGIVAILDDINQKMSTWITNSELSIINTSASTDWIAVSAELYEVLSTADRISRETDGAFDITVGPLVNLWGFGPDKLPAQIPAEDEIAQTKLHTGYQLLELRASPAAVRKRDAKVYIDLSGIVPGYAADRIAEYLEQLSITDYLVDITGEIRARGRNARHEAWRIGIEKPLPDRQSVQHIVALDDTGLSTAGDYRNFFMVDGRRYSHTIDPETGRPVTHDLTLVTVLNRSAMIADALDTAFMVMGAEQALTYANKHDIPALFIQNRDNQLNEQYSRLFGTYLIE